MNVRSPLCIGSLLVLSGFVGTAPAMAGPDAWTGGGPDLAWVTTLLRPYGPLGDLYAGTYGGGVWKSTDGGETWVDATSNLRGTVVWDLAHGGGQFPTLYAATGDAGMNSSIPPYDRWTPINSGLGSGDPLSVQKVVVHPGSPQVITVATNSGVATSDQRGALWPIGLQWLTGFTFVDVEVHHLAPARIYALQSSELYVTDDFGRSLYRYDQARGLPYDLLEDLELWPTSLDTLFVVSRTRGVYRGIPGPYFYYSGPAEQAADNPVLYQMKVVPETRELLLASAEGVYLSGDVGRTWRKLDDGLDTTHQEVWSILVDDPRSLRLMLGSFRYGFVKSDIAGERWRESNRGLQAALVNGVWADGDRVVAATAHGKVFASEDRGATWEDRTGNLDILQARDAIVFGAPERWLVTSNTGLWISDDGGAAWRLPTVPPAEPIARTLLHAPWWPQDELLVGTFHGVYHSVDGGETWARLEDVPTDASYLAMGAAPVDQTLWLGAVGDALYEGSLAGGFTRVPSGPSQSRTYFDVAFPDGDGTTVLVATGGGLFRFEATGNGIYTSTAIDEGLPAPFVGGTPDVSGVEVVDGSIFVGLADDGVYRSDDGGATWTDYGDGIRVPHVQELTLVEGSDPRLCMATWGGGVVERDVSPAVATPPRTVGAGARLLPAWPNPFNPRVHLAIELDGPAHVELAIFDVRGRRVRTLLQARRDGGRHELVWDGRDDRDTPVPSGVYLVRLQVDATTVTSQRLTLLR